jgi:NhaA family Na+:H+ antiporter
MALFIASAAFADPADYAAAKIAIFLASLGAGALGVLNLWASPGAVEERDLMSESG